MTGDRDYGAAQPAFVRMYLDRLAKDEVTLTQAAEGIARGDVAAAERVFRLAHGLAGASGIFGFADIGALAQRTEACAEAAFQAEAGRMFELVELVAKLLEGMREILERPAEG